MADELDFYFVVPEWYLIPSIHIVLTGLIAPIICNHPEVSLGFAIGVLAIVLPITKVEKTKKR